MSDELFKFSHERIINALHRFRRRYPASYRNFFLSELEKPYSPFDPEAIVMLTENDENVLRKPTLTFPVEVVEDEDS